MAIGKVQVGFVGDNTIWKNFMMNLGSYQAGGTLFPEQLNADGYPVGITTNTFFGTIPSTPVIGVGETMVFAWKGAATHSGGTSAILLQCSSSTTITSDPGSVVKSTGVNLGFAGTDGYVEFNWAGSTTSTFITFNFVGGSTFTNFGSIIFCRKSDYASLSNPSIQPGDLLSDAFVNALAPLNAKCLRYLAFNDVNDNCLWTQHRYRHNWKTSLSFTNPQWLPSCWAGTTSGTNTYTVGSYPDMPASYTMGEVVQCRFVNAGSGTITINIGGRGPVPMYSMFGGNFVNQITSIGANQNVTMMYDDILNAYIYQTAGYGNTGFNGPIEAAVALANRTNTGLWWQFPTHITTTDTAYEGTNSVAQTTQYIRDNLASGLPFYIEYMNECWNASFPYDQNTNYAIQVANLFGFGNSQPQSYQRFYGWKMCVIQPIVKAAWSPRNPAELHRTLMHGVVAEGVGIGSGVQLDRFEGRSLAPSGAGTGAHGLGNALWNSYTGSADFTAFPNRPIDNVETVGYAPYYSGAQFGTWNETSWFSGGSTSGGPTGTTSPSPWTTGLQGAALAYAAGDAQSIANAFAFMDWDLTNGTANGAAGANTLSTMATTYASWEALYHVYDGARPSGMANLETATYEGAMECAAPVNLATMVALSFFPLQSTTTATLSPGAHPLVSWTAHGLQNGALVGFASTGSLPTGIATYNFAAGKGNSGGTQYYVISATTDTFDVSTTLNGSPITTSGSLTGTLTIKGSNWGGPAGLLQTLLNAYKFSNNFERTVRSQFTVLTNAGAAHGRVTQPCWFLFNGSKVWGMYGGTVLNSTPYASYDAVRNFDNSRRRLILKT